MEALLSILIALLASASVWLMLSRNLVRFLFGLVLIGNVANLVIFTTGGLTWGRPAFVADGDQGTGLANALPQALVLTAIVIGFGLVSFTLALAVRAWQALGTTDIDKMRLAEPATTPEDAAKRVDERVRAQTAGDVERDVGDPVPDPPGDAR